MVLKSKNFKKHDWGFNCPRSKRDSSEIADLIISSITSKAYILRSTGKLFMYLLGDSTPQKAFSCYFGSQIQKPLEEEYWRLALAPD